MFKTRYRLDIQFTGPLLGSQPGKDTLASDFLTKKYLNENENNPKKLEEAHSNISEESESLPQTIDKGTTGFHRNTDNKPILYNYQIKGLLKECGDVLNGINGVKALRSKIENTLFISPRQIIINTDQPITFLERPLRAQTQQGPRVTLARSEMIAEGATLSCEIECWDTTKFSMKEDLLRELLDYGTQKGLGQWRGSGIYGMHTYTLTKL